MLIVGSDRLSPSGPSGAPEGTRHAVDRQGRVLCRSSRARFTWPHLAWETVSSDDAACRLCSPVRAAQEALSHFDPYPSDQVQTALPSGTPAFAGWLPAPGLFVPDEQ